MNGVSQTIWHGDARDLVNQIPRPVDCIVVDPPYGMAFKSNSAQLPSRLPRKGEK